MRIMAFGRDCLLQEFTTLDWAQVTASQALTYWIDMTGPAQEHIQTMHEVMKLHPLAVEDTYNQYQRGKIEEYDEQLFIIVNTLMHANGELVSRELDIFVGRTYLITVHRDPEPLIDHAIQRVKTPNFRLPMSSGYLLYALLDTVIDNYFPILEVLGERIEDLEDEILERPAPRILRELMALKRHLRQMWQTVWPEQSVLSALVNHDEGLIDHRSLEYYFRDVYDHLLRIAELINTLRDTLTGVVDIYMSSTSNRLNIIVNRLTVYTLLIGALTVIGGFYGMNFAVTWPPFDNPNSILIVIGLMIAVVLLLVMFFRRRKLI